MQIPRTKIDAFWKWFSSNCQTLEEMLARGDTKGIADRMQHRIKSLFPQVGWEIGPGESKRYFLAITLNGDLRNIDVVQQIIERAPVIEDWEFYAGRPKRPWQKKLILHNPAGQAVELDIESWQYGLVGFQDNSFFDVSIFAPHLPKMDLAAKQQMLETVLQACLGEQVALQRLDKMEFVDSPSEEWFKNATPMRNLWDHIMQVGGEFRHGHQ